MDKLAEALINAPHFTKAKEMVLRTRKDESVDESFLKSRSQTIELLNEMYLPGLEKPSLVSSCYGAIEKLLLTIPDWVFTYDPYLNAYKDLLYKMPEHTRFVIYINSLSVVALEVVLDETNTRGRVEVVETPQSSNFTVWAEDAYVVCEDLQDSETYFVEPASFNRAEDNMIADYLALKPEYNATLKNLYFQGGNILIGRDNWLIGLDYPNNSLKYDFIIPEAGESKFAAIQRGYKQIEHQKSLIPIGSTLNVPTEKHVDNLDVGGGRTLPLIAYYGNQAGTVQPIFHIDMFITMAGEDANGTPIVLVGDPSITKDLLPNEEWVQYLDRFSMSHIFNDYANNLQAAGFVVVRNPISVCVEHSPATLRDPEFLYTYFATSNNALVEITAESKKVWLPSYGHGNYNYLSIIDSKNMEIWQSLGFEAILLGDFHPFASSLGSVHCISKYVKRGSQ